MNKKRSLRNIRKYFKLNKNENNTAKTMVREKFIALNAHIRTKE